MAGEQISKIDIEQVIQRFPRLGMSGGMSTQGQVIRSPLRRCAECIAHHQGANSTCSPRVSPGTPMALKPKGSSAPSPKVWNDSRVSSIQVSSAGTKTGAPVRLAKRWPGVRASPR